MIAEEFRPVSGYEGIYEVSDLGRVRSLDRIDSRGHRRKGFVLNPWKGAGKYLYVTLCNEGRMNPRRVHQLVLEEFVGPRPDGWDSCHNSGDIYDNRLSNLRYDTKSGNMRDKKAHGTDQNATKTHCKRNHEFIPENTYMHGGHRTCKACRRLNHHARKAS